MNDWPQCCSTRDGVRCTSKDGHYPTTPHGTQALFWEEMGPAHHRKLVPERSEASSDQGDTE